MQYTLASMLGIGILGALLYYRYGVVKRRKAPEGFETGNRSNHPYTATRGDTYAAKHPELYRLLTLLYDSLLTNEYALPQHPYEVPWDLKVEYLTEKYESAFYRALAKDMKTYLDLRRILEVEAFKDSEGIPRTEYRGRASVRGWYLHRIEVWVHPKSTLYHNAATLAHEITHAFLYSYNIEETDRLQNERLTDIAAIFIGFDDIYRQGSTPIEVTKELTPQGRRYYSFTSGYLSDEELADTLRCIEAKRSEYRQEYHRRQKERQKQEQTETLLRKRQEILVQAADNLLGLYAQNRRILEEIDFTAFMQQIGDRDEHACFINNCKEFMNRALYRELVDLQEQISETSYSGGLEARAHHALGQMARTLSRWNAIVGKYL